MKFENSGTNPWQGLKNSTATQPPLDSGEVSGATNQNNAYMLYFEGYKRGQSELSGDNTKKYSLYGLILTATLAIVGTAITAIITFYTETGNIYKKVAVLEEKINSKEEVSTLHHNRFKEGIDKLEKKLINIQTSVDKNTNKLEHIDLMQNLKQKK